jgi:hypothetical protein
VQLRRPVAAARELRGKLQPYADLIQAEANAS